MLYLLKRLANYRKKRFSLSLSPSSAHSHVSQKDRILGSSSAYCNLFAWLWNFQEIEKSMKMKIWHRSIKIWHGILLYLGFYYILLYSNFTIFGILLYNLNLNLQKKMQFILYCNHLLCVHFCAHKNCTNTVLPFFSLTIRVP